MNRLTKPSKVALSMTLSVLYEIYHRKSQIMCKKINPRPAFKSKSIETMTTDEIYSGITSDEINQQVIIEGIIQPLKAKKIKFKVVALVKNVKGEWEPKNLTLRFDKVSSFFRFDCANISKRRYYPIKEKR